MGVLQAVIAALVTSGGGGGGGNTPNFIVAASGANASGAAVSSAVDTTGAKELWATGTAYSSGTATITDSKGNTWALQNSGGTVIDSGSPASVFVYKTNDTINGGAITVGVGHTFTSTSGSSFGSTVLAIAVGPSAGGALTSTAFSFTADATSPHTSASVDPTGDKALLIAFGYHNGTGNPTTYDWSGSTFTERCSEKDASSFWTGSIATRTVNAAGGFTASFASSGSPVDGNVALIAVTEA